MASGSLQPSPGLYAPSIAPFPLPPQTFLPSTTTKMSMQELDELRKKLGNVTAISNAPQVSRYHSLSVLLRQGCVAKGGRQGRGKEVEGQVENRKDGGRV